MDHRQYLHSVPNSEYAVLMVHGICGTPDHFRALLPLIPQNWTVHNLLLAGHGKGVRDFSAASMDRWKTQVEHHLTLLRRDHTKILIVGHSMGCLLAMEEALRDPAQIAGLFLLNAPLKVHLPPSTMLISLGAAFGMARFPKVAAMLRDTSITLSPRLWEYLGWMPRFWELLMLIRRVRPRLPQLQVPVSSFHSQKDELVSGRSSTYLERIPGGTHTVLPGSGHFHYPEEDLNLLKTRFQEILQKNFP